MKLSTTHQIVIGCAAALLILVLLGEIAYRTADTVGESGGMATRTQSVLLFSESLSGQLTQVDRAVRTMTAPDAVVSPDVPTEAYRTGTSRIRESLRLLNAYTWPDLPHYERFVTIHDLVEAKLLSLEALVDAQGDSTSSAITVVESSEALTARLQDEIQQLQRSELEYLTTETVDDSILAQRTQYSILLVTLGAIVFLTVGASLMVGDLKGRKRAETRLRESEQRFRTLAANAPIGVFLTDQDGHFTFVNDRYAIITGRTFDEVSGKPWTDGLHPDDRDAVCNQWQQKAARGDDFVAEFRSVRPDGRVVWLFGRSAALCGDDGTVEGFVGTVSDITDRKLAEAERDRFFNLSLDMLSITDFHGRLRRFNPAWMETLGLSPEELQASRSIDLVHPDDRDATEKESARLKRGGAIARFENRLRAADGSYRWLSWNAASDMDSKLIYSIARDVTEGRELQEQLRKKNEELERQNDEVATATRLKSEFLANMSHELRTPLNGIIGFAELMREGHGGPVTQTHEEFLDDILLSSRHLLSLINDILDLAKVEAGKIAFEPTKIDLTRVVGEVHQTVREMAADGQIDLKIEIDPSLPEIELDPVRLKQVLYNYVSNALKFTNPRGTVVVRARPMSSDMFRLEVEDSGIGIRPEDIGKLFMEFQQLDEGASKKFQGTGLGLALTKRIVEAQGGTVGVSSRWGEGSTFSAVLPVHGTEAAPSETGRDRDTPHRTNRLLIVRGTGQTEISLAEKLTPYRLETRIVERGTEAMEVAAIENFDAIVLDLDLPDMDGRDLINAIRTTGRHPSTPVIAVTSSEDRRIIPGLAVQGFIERPVSAEMLIETLKRAGLRIAPDRQKRRQLTEAGDLA